MNTNLEVFRDICREMYVASNLLATRKGEVLYEKGYGKVIQLVMRTQYKELLPLGGLTLEQIGYLFGTTRERIRQVEEEVLGTSSTKKGYSKTRKRIGKILSPRPLGCRTYTSNIEKFQAIRELREYMREVYLTRKDT